MVTQPKETKLTCNRPYFKCANTLSAYVLEGYTSGWEEVGKQWNFLQPVKEEKDVLLFLDKFAELRNATVSFVTSASLSVRLTAYPAVCPSAGSNSAPNGRTFIKFEILVFFENLTEKIKVLLKSEKNGGYFT